MMSRTGSATVRVIYVFSTVVVLSLAFVNLLLSGSLPSHTPENLQQQLVNTLSNSYTASSGKSSKTIYLCGYEGLLKPIAKSLFPEYYDIRMLLDRDPNTHKAIDYSKILSSSSVSDDNIVILASYGGMPCAGIRPEPTHRSVLLPQLFRGPILYVNGESYPSYSTNQRPRLYSLGHEQDNWDNNQVRVYFAVLNLMSFPMAEQRKLYDHSRKPKSSGEHFLLFIHSHCVEFRDQAFLALAEIGPVHAGGKCPGNKAMEGVETAKRVQLTLPNSYNRNSMLFARYRFALVMENLNKEGYITEKIVNAFLGGAIPIWYGTREIFDIFNKDAFVYYDIENPEEALERIRYLEQNKTAFEEVRNAPILKDGDETVRKYFSLRDDVGGGYLKNQIRALMKKDL